MSKLTLARAKELLAKHTSEEHLFTHAAAVSAAMGAMAEHFGAGAEKEHWQAIGYLHDVDYEKFPDEHCRHVRELLAPEGVEEEDIHAIITHGYGLVTEEAEPATEMEKSLFAVDELTGIVHAYALMRPERMKDMSVKSLKKKFKDKRFAAKCNRNLIQQGFDMLGLDAGTVMECCIKGMQEHESELALD
jgi:predicted hydrolase (HD superfamily)